MPVRSRRFLVAVGLLLVLVLSFTFARSDRSRSNKQILSLVPPALVQSAEAANYDILSDIATEAGISAYYQTPSSINLDLVRDDFVTIEIDTSTYIVGSVDITNYDDELDAHVYIDESGWILAYYLKVDPVAKMADPKGNTVTNTLLKDAVATMASAAGQPFGDVNYYDFRYPNATNIMFIGEKDNGSNDDSYTVEAPSSYGYFERSWSTTNKDSFYLNGVRVGNVSYNGSSDYGYITTGEFPTDVTHTIWIPSSGHYGVLVIVYQIPS